MGYWFNKKSKNLSWRKTPTKIGDKWYTPSGKVISNPDAYFKTVKKRGKYWKKDTGWKKSNWDYL